MQVNLDSPLPDKLEIGDGTALFVCGTCFDRDRELRSLHVIVDGDPQPAAAYGMPRLDYFRSMHPGIDPFAPGRSDAASDEDPNLNSYASGFWAMVTVPPRPGRAVCELLLHAGFAGGDEETVPLAEIPLSAPPEPAEFDVRHGPDPLVAICMATHDPPDDLLRRQLDSIRAQSYGNWVCVISDDCSRPDRYEALREAVKDDPRFVISRSPRRLGFYLNFERALTLAPRQARYVALADQDDFWYPEKLAVLLDWIGDAQLIYSDARIVSRGGDMIAPTYWGVRRRNHDDLLSLLVANCVTGAASLFRREVLDVALPFPPSQFAHYHDHWLALVARMLGSVVFVDVPLYDYVQHTRAALGHATATRVVPFRERLRKLRGDSHERVRFYREWYFRDAWRLYAFAKVLELRCAGRAASCDRRTLERFLALERSWPALVAFAWRAARELTGPSETLGAEWALLRCFVWRRVLTISARRRPTRRLRLDAVPPDDLAPRGERRELRWLEASRSVTEKIAPLELAVSDDAPRRINVLIPTIDLEHFFGGYIAKLNLASRLAERGARVRLVTADPVGPLPNDWRDTVESYSGLRGLFDRVEVAFGRGPGPLAVSRRDAFLATTWWTAHLAHSACHELGGARFVYLIQEYEPFTFPMGTMAALAAESYEFPHLALFSTELLRGYFRHHGIGVYRDGSEAGDRASAPFQNAITSVAARSEEELRGRPNRRLLFYARPEPHAARNMFELGILAIQRALEEGVFRDGWELRGIGTVGAGRRIPLEGHAELDMIPRRSPAEYAKLLPDYDVGLALMYTPHPSLVPIEMASAGLLTVTNTFENKTAEALAAISSNLICGEPTIAGVARALGEAAGAVDDVERRVRGSDVRWSRDWDTSLHDDLLARLESFLAVT